MPYKDKEKKRAHDATYNAKHREEKRARDAAYHLDNREEILERKRRYNADHREKKRAYDTKHREEILTYQATYRADHREEIRERMRQRDLKLGKQFMDGVYGHFCHFCSLDVPVEELVRHHLNGDGEEEREELGVIGSWEKAIAEQDPTRWATTHDRCHKRFHKTKEKKT